MKTTIQSLKMLFFMTLLTGVFYPLLVLLFAHVAFPWKASGSFLYNNDKLIGSKLIGQNFKEDRYFWGRPSSVDYNPMPAGASNEGPTSAKLKQQIEERRKKIITIYNVQDPNLIPQELLCTSGSGIDPHISLEAARFQLSRIAKARSISIEEAEQLLEKSQERILGKLFLSNHINVLLLNQLLDQFLNEGKNKP